MNCNTNHHTIQSVAPKKTTTLLALSSVSFGTANAFEICDNVDHAESIPLESVSSNATEPPREIIGSNLPHARRNKSGLLKSRIETKTNHLLRCPGPSKKASKRVFGKLANIAIAILVIGCCISIKDHNLIVQSNNNATADPQTDVSKVMKIDEEEVFIGGEVDLEEKDEPIDLKTIIETLENVPKDDTTITVSSLLPADAAKVPNGHNVTSPSEEESAESDDEWETYEEEVFIGGEVESEEKDEPIDLKSIIDTLDQVPKEDTTTTFSSLLPANAATLPKNHTVLGPSESEEGDLQTASEALDKSEQKTSHADKESGAKTSHLEKESDKSETAPEKTSWKKMIGCAFLAATICGGLVGYNYSEAIGRARDEWVASMNDKDPYTLSQWNIEYADDFQNGASIKRQSEQSKWTGGQSDRDMLRFTELNKLDLSQAKSDYPFNTQVLGLNTTTPPSTTTPAPTMTPAPITTPASTMPLNGSHF